jgi:hypothetical protein
LEKSEIGNAGIYAFDDDRRYKVPVNAKKLIEEIVTLFGYSFTRTKWLIHDWTKEQKPDFCLKFYWKSHEIVGTFGTFGTFGTLAMPIVTRVMASTVGQDLVAVTPMSAPTGTLMYLDYTYGENVDINKNQIIGVSSRYGVLDHSTPNYVMAVDPIDDNPQVNVSRIEVMRSQREETVRKWSSLGFLEGLTGQVKDNIAALYESQARQLLE